MTTRGKERKTGRKGKSSPDLPVITLLTDFGTADYFVGAVKGAILSVNPHAVIADITHEIPPQDIEAGAFTLLAAYPTFPAGTIHVAVVDPGVGSARRAIIVEAGKQFFVGPDNGIFSYIYDREPSQKIFHVTAEKYFRRPTSSTFHGRDVFAPVAAALSKGIKPEALGSPISDEVRLRDSLTPGVARNGDVQGRIIHIDRFGNCITNLTRESLGERSVLVVNGKRITTFREFYDGAGKAPFAIWGSAGFLEISVNGGSAATALKVERGEAVLLAQRRKDAKL
ncbi:MAG TPA: SAM-dependent chlorinase/fluorinase [Pyrinomonadaceae bacterium]|nr:SAM-dependent chlorinase/fluorinase [Pyrinomonadaceae bacterium]